MSLDVHAVSVISGSSPLSNPDRVKLGILTGVAIAAIAGAMTGGQVEAPGSGFTSIPTLSAAGGTGGTITPSMALATSSEAAAGTTYAPGDTITETGGTASQQAILEVLTTKAVTAPAVAAGGTGYAVGDNITLQDGMVVQVATLSTTAVATVTIVNGGSFPANNVAAGGLTQVSTTGAGTGATFTMTAAKYGVNTYGIQNAGSYSVLPSSPISQGSTSGSGTGFQLTALTWQVASFTATGGAGYAHGAAVTATGGAGTGFEGSVSTEPDGETISMQITSFAELPASYGVHVTPNAPCAYSVSNKTQTQGFTLTFAPLASGSPLEASAFDLLIIA